MKTSINNRKDCIEYRSDSDQLLLSLYLYPGFDRWEVGSYGNPSSFKIDSLESFASDLLLAIRCAKEVISTGELPQ